MTIDFASNESGYQVEPLLDRAEIVRLRSVFDGIGVDPSEPRFVSGVHCERSRARELDRLMRVALAPAVTALLGDYQPFFGALIAKGARQGARIDFHQDWTYTDERSHRAIAAWVPLVDVDAENGAMEVIPGSQRWTSGLRVSNAVDQDEPTAPFQESFARQAISLPMRAGEVLLYDPAIVHGSPPNLTDAIRPIVGIVVAPTGAALVHFRREADGQIQGFGIEYDDFYMDGHFSGPGEFPLVTPWTTSVTEADFGRFTADQVPSPGPEPLDDHAVDRAAFNPDTAAVGSAPTRLTSHDAARRARSLVGRAVRRLERR